VCWKERKYWKGKEKETTASMNDSQRNLHKKFCDSHSSKMCYAKFCYLRPPWIVELLAKDRETCLCVRHANMELLIERMHRLGIINERSPSAVKLCVMQTQKLACMVNVAIDNLE